MFTESQQREFENRFPHAAAYVRECELVNEYRRYRDLYCEMLTDWQTKRMGELETLFKKTGVLTETCEWTDRGWDML